MTPKLYNRTGTSLIGNLTNCIECLVEEERNGAFELTLQYSNTEAIAASLLYDNIIGTREGIESDIPVVIKKKEKKYNEENFRIKELIEVSYLLCTNSTKVNKKLVKKSFKAFDSNKDSKALVKQLGNSISKYYKDDKESLPMMFKAFGYAQPLIDSRYRDAKDDFDLLVGVNARAYTNFILNNKTVRKQYIKKIALT